MDVISILLTLLTILTSIIGVILTIRMEMRKHREQMMIQAMVETILPFYAKISEIHKKYVLYITSGGLLDTDYIKFDSKKLIELGTETFAYIREPLAQHVILISCMLVDFVNRMIDSKVGKEEIIEYLYTVISLTREAKDIVKEALEKHIRKFGVTEFTELSTTREELEDQFQEAINKMLIAIKAKKEKRIKAKTETKSKKVKKKEKKEKTEKKTQKVYLKIVIIGGPMVGKTCLAKTFVSGKFPGESKRTLGLDLYIKKIEIERKDRGKTELTLLITDIGGQKYWVESNFPLYFKGARGLIVCFDLTRPESLYWISSKLVELSKENPDFLKDIKKSAIVLVGCKSDMGKKVSEEEIEKVRELLEKIFESHVPYIETSAKLNKNVDKIFETMINLIIQRAIKQR